MKFKVRWGVCACVVRSQSTRAKHLFEATAFVTAKLPLINILFFSFLIAFFEIKVPGYNINTNDLRV